jgi:hypothetical protein
LYPSGTQQQGAGKRLMGKTKVNTLKNANGANSQCHWETITTSTCHKLESGVWFLKWRLKMMPE